MKLISLTPVRAALAAEKLGWTARRGVHEMVESAWQGWLLHHGTTSRVVVTEDADLGLLAGDRLYALGLAGFAITALIGRRLHKQAHWIPGGAVFLAWIIAMLAVPILIQVFFNAGLAYWLNKKVGEKHNVACPSALIGASNFFELAVAVTIGLFGLDSGAALVTVVGVLVEVPVMLSLHTLSHVALGLGLAAR